MQLAYALPRLARLAETLVREVLAAYHDNDADRALAAWARDEELDEQYTGLFRELLTYMMAETSYYQQLTISARRFQQQGAFGRIYSCESEYHHAGLDSLFVEQGERTWRYGFPPMHYPTHCTAHLLSVTGERITDVTCIGWGDGDPILPLGQ